MKQYLLNAKGCSGRGVRVRTLDGPQRAQIKTESAKDLGPDATNAEWYARESVLGIIATVTQVTKKAGMKKPEELLSAEWEKISAEDLEKKLGELFCAKDLAALEKIFRALHDVTDKEVDDILGEGLDVIED
jgi:hypothetical protein